jgi:hypothetical protein
MSIPVLDTYFADVFNDIENNQTKMITIVDNETNRLTKKEQNINDLVASKERAIQLNMNYIQRKEQYRKMMIYLIIGLSVILAVVILKMFLPIPSAVVTLCVIVVFAVVAIYSFQIYVQINNRDDMDFDKIKMKPPSVLSSTQIQNQLAENSKISSANGVNILSSMDLGLCIGSACCSNNTVWDVNGQVCKHKPTSETFVTNDKFQPMLTNSSLRGTFT